MGFLSDFQISSFFLFPFCHAPKYAVTSVNVESKFPQNIFSASTICSLPDTVLVMAMDFQDINVVTKMTGFGLF